MTTDERLERDFRRLLRAYPAWYRRARGEEMLTTLMDAARGRDRPTLGERVDIVFGGLRKHLAARSVPAAVVSVLAAVFVATLGAIGGAVAGWYTATDLPGDAAASHIARQAIPDMDTKDVYGDRSLFYWVDMNGNVMPTPFDLLGNGDGYNSGDLSYELEHKDDGFARFRAAERRVVKAGWHVQAVRKDKRDAAFSATRDGLVLQVSTVADATSTSVSFVTIKRTTPPLVPILTVVGLILGSLAGWAALTRLLRRIAVWPRRRRAVVYQLLGCGGFMLIVPTAVNLYFIGASLIVPEQRVAVWLGYTWGPLSIMTLLGAIALGGALLLCGPTPMGTRVMRTAR
ncbi:MAG TPA: hypothetical protein VE172_00765 [Stackebrandtia sp.]|jgi:hypothetical protein|uniref:hypothetical protein n=1 Tax=Stackebrandtia sp. TaxID=2023065 RepID=UPI002D75BA0A|nr:hypothetical protein [Stackebrandtia sp.]HZE37321.1 hypothetical protein [Stackebrandtia sp.]